jgi:uncharacterized membrane protein
MGETVNAIPRRFRVALGLSLGVNLLVAGLAVGAWMHGPPGLRDGKDLGFGPFDEAFRPEDRAGLRDAVRAKSGNLRDLRRVMGEDLASVVAALRAEPFDPGALKAALATQAQHLSQRMAVGTEVIGTYLLALPEAERHAFADRIEHRLRGKHE